MKSKPASESGGVADINSVRKAFSQVNEHITGLVKIMQHNGNVVQNGFYRNDIWLECFKQVLSDIAIAVVRLSGDNSIQMREDGNEIAWELYWKEANERVLVALREADEKKQARKHEPENPLILREPGDEVIDFGGDYEDPNAQRESAESSEADAGRNDGEQDELRQGDEAAPLSPVQADGGTVD